MLAKYNGKGTFGIPEAGDFEAGEEREVTLGAARFCMGQPEFTVTFTDRDELAYKKEDGRVGYVGFIGAIDSRFGYGSAAITILQALQLAGIEASCPYNPYYQDLPQAVRDQVQYRKWIPKIEIVHSTPDWFQFAQSPVVVAWTMFETSQLPTSPDAPFGGNWVARLNEIDSIVVPCQHNKQVFEASGVTTPVTVIPYAVDPEPWPYFERPERDIFTVIQYGDLTTRKGPLEAVEAFQRAFPFEPDVRLILKTFAGRFANGGMRYAPTFTDPRIKIIDEEWSRDRLVAQLRASDCGIWLSRGEGFGLPPAQMALTGLPVVMTTHTGMAEYYDPKFFYGVDSPTMSPSPITGDWYEPDVDQAAAQLRKVYDDRKEARRRGKAASTYLKKKLSLEMMSSKLYEYLSHF